MRGRFGSPLGNPFKVKHEDERPGAIVMYEKWLRAKIAEGDRAVVSELEALTHNFVSHETLTLLCWCKPKACHGDVIACILQEQIGNK